MTQPPESVGKAAAEAAWHAQGREMLLRPGDYMKAASELDKNRFDRAGLFAAQHAFDRTLAQLAVNSSTIIRPKLPPKRARRA